MLLFRWAILLLLLAAGVSLRVLCRHRPGHVTGASAWIVLKWTLLAAFGFFAVLIAERLA